MGGFSYPWIKDRSNTNDNYPITKKTKIDNLNKIINEFYDNVVLIDDIIKKLELLALNSPCYDDEDFSIYNKVIKELLYKKYRISNDIARKENRINELTNSEEGDGNSDENGDKDQSQES